MSRRDEHNASHYSARYAERKRAAERARDANAGPSPCNRCPEPQVPGAIFCAEHCAEYARMLSKLHSGGTSVAALTAFCERTYWPESR